MAWCHWNSVDGPMLTPRIPAAEVRALTDTVEQRVVGERPELARFVQDADPEAPELWLRDDGVWPHPDLLRHPAVMKLAARIPEVDP